MISDPSLLFLTHPVFPEDKQTLNLQICERQCGPPHTTLEMDNDLRNGRKAAKTSDKENFSKIKGKLVQFISSQDSIFKELKSASWQTNLT